MIRSKAMSEIIVGMKLSTLDSVLIGSQTFCPGTRIERSYESDKPSASIIFEIGHSPVRHLFTKTIVVRVPWDSSSSKGKGEGEGLTLDVERSADPPYCDRQCHNNPISVPDSNASNINEHLIPEKC